MGVDSGSRWNLWVCLAGDGCGWNLWMWLVGVVVRRYTDFAYPYSSCIWVFFSSIPTLLFIKKVFRHITRVFTTCGICY